MDECPGHSEQKEMEFWGRRKDKEELMETSGSRKAQYVVTNWRWGGQAGGQGERVVKGEKSHDYFLQLEGDRQWAAGGQREGKGIVRSVQEGQVRWPEEARINETD